MKYTIQYHCLTNKGKIRSINQDNFVCSKSQMNQNCQNSDSHGSINNGPFALFAVFDGMGGYESGEVAAEIAAKKLIDYEITDDPAQDLSNYCYAANRAIVGHSFNHNITQMGTTAAMLLFDTEEIYLCNIGDSKIFRYSKGNLSQISKDHVVAGDYGTKPFLSQNLGIRENEMIIEPYLSKGSYLNHDRYLICSDGLTDMVSEEDIAYVLGTFSISYAINKLMEMALEHGGIDNITILICEVITEATQKIRKLFSLE